MLEYIGDAEIAKIRMKKRSARRPVRHNHQEEQRK